MLFAPVELKGFSQLELERHVGIDDDCAAFDSPATDEFGDSAVVTGKAGCLDFSE